MTNRSQPLGGRRSSDPIPPSSPPPPPTRPPLAHSPPLPPLRISSPTGFRRFRQTATVVVNPNASPSPASPPSTTYSPSTTSPSRYLPASSSYHSLPSSKIASASPPPGPISPKDSSFSSSILQSVWASIKRQLVTFLIQSLSEKILHYFINLPASIQLRGLFDNLRLRDLRVNVQTVNEDLDKYGIPAALKYGHLEYMDIKLYIAHSQVQVILQGLVLVFGPRKFSQSPSVSISSAQSSSSSVGSLLRHLTSMEEEGKSLEAYSKGDESYLLNYSPNFNVNTYSSSKAEEDRYNTNNEEGFSSVLRWMLRYVPNIRIRIDQVFIRYEDDQIQPLGVSKSSPSEGSKEQSCSQSGSNDVEVGEPLAFGIRLKRLLIQPEQKRVSRTLSERTNSSEKHRFHTVNSTDSRTSMSKPTSREYSFSQMDSTKSHSTNTAVAGSAAASKLVYWVKVSELGIFLDGAAEPELAGVERWGENFRSFLSLPVATVLPSVSSNCLLLSRPASSATSYPTGDISPLSPAVSLSPAATAPLPPAAFSVARPPPCWLHPPSRDDNAGVLYVSWSVFAGTCREPCGVYDAITIADMREFVNSSKPLHFWLVEPTQLEALLGFTVPESSTSLGTGYWGGWRSGNETKGEDLVFSIDCRVGTSSPHYTHHGRHHFASEWGRFNANWCGCVRNCWRRMESYFQRECRKMEKKIKPISPSCK